MELTDKDEIKLVEKFRRGKSEWLMSGNGRRLGHGNDEIPFRMMVEFIPVGKRGGIIRCYAIPRECIK